MPARSSVRRLSTASSFPRSPAARPLRSARRPLADYRLGLLVACFAASLSSCSPAPRSAALTPTAGRLTVNGRPAVDALVVLAPLLDSAPADSGARVATTATARTGGEPTALLDRAETGFPRGRVAADGRFVIGTYAKDDGAPAGDYRLVIAWRRPVDRPAPDGSGVPDDDEADFAPSSPFAPPSAWRFVSVRPPLADLGAIDLQF